ncbi:hypothetical protein TIFTF001_023016 [Ficus carica]|uniref:Retrotransposon gag domain-containing protein n=1 Tax=Ficus carica TaxID=3494 RepID=A0AA88DDA7_FICCA|nr:hypothetical protein TIFTF001_023016 [Ficus carica]
MPQMKEYDRTIDPVGFLHLFLQVMILETTDNDLLCRVFPRMLTGAAAIWFNQLEPGSINSFKQLTQIFVTQFIYDRKQKQIMGSLMKIKMGEKENLKSYLLRFTNELNQIKKVDSGLVAKIFYQGLQVDRDLKEQLGRNRPKDMSEVIYHAKGSIRVEEARMAGKRKNIEKLIERI